MHHQEKSKQINQSMRKKFANCISNKNLYHEYIDNRVVGG